MRIPNEVHLGQAWRIHELLADFTLEDVWRLTGVEGRADEFGRAVALLTSADPGRAASGPTRLLWTTRDVLGRWFGLGEVSSPDPGEALPIPGTTETTVAARLPDDLVGTAAALRFEHLPFVPLYRTDDELAAELSNRTVHGVLHLSWVGVGGGAHQAQMAVYVKPRGRLGQAYMAFIKPFRHLIVYPAMERQVARAWRARAD